MQRLSNVRKTSSCTSSQSDLHPSRLAFLLLGAGSSGTSQESKGHFEYIFIAIDKFTKWIEYKPLVKYSATKAVEFIQDIIHHFGMPNQIITDLGSPFTATEFQSWAHDYGFGIDYASVTHPEANR
jgi:hypothetical protein